jgi:probable rRNA maturation factor
MPITFSYQATSVKPSEKKKIIDWILLVAYLEHREIDDISYIICTDKYLLALNKKFLKHDEYTDIITFDTTVKKKIAAEIYISADRIQANAKTYHTTVQTELRRVLIHGILHCCGYGDKTASEKIKMRKKEDEYLQLFSNL